MNLVQSVGFQEDVISALDWTLERFGEKAKERYIELIRVGLSAISEHPLLPNSREFEGRVRLYHLRFSKNDARVNGIAVRSPRHFVAYRVNAHSEVEMLRLLHDSMDLGRQLGDID